MLSQFHALLFATVALAAIEPSFSSFAYSGSGCPLDTASYWAGSFGSTSNYATLNYKLNEFTPFYGPGVSVRDQQRQCVVMLDIGVDPAYRLRINNNSTVFTGFVKLATSSQSVINTANYTFTANPSVQSVSGAVVKGSVLGRFRAFASLANGAGLLSPCGGGTLRADMRARIAPGNRAPYFEDGETQDFWDIQTGIELVVC